MANIRKSYLPTKAQLDAAEALINELDLTTAAKDDDGQPVEALKPKNTYNPVLQHFYQCVQKRALDKEAALPPLDPAIAKYLNPDGALFAKAKQALEDFEQKFPVTKLDANKSKLERRFWRDTLANAADISLESYGAEAKKAKKDGDTNFNMDIIISSGTSEVGSIKPVQDFKNMLARRDIDLVDKGKLCSLLNFCITHLFNYSY